MTKGFDSRTMPSAASARKREVRQFNGVAIYAVMAALAAAGILIAGLFALTP
jgi:hypothetical protein